MTIHERWEKTHRALDILDGMLTIIGCADSRERDKIDTAAELLRELAKDAKIELVGSRP